MHIHPTETLSVWLTNSRIRQGSPLSRNVTADVAVIGAGIAGMTTAYLLARQGQSVVVIDDGPVGSGETGRTTAHLTAALDDRYYEIKRLHGELGAKYAAQSHVRAIDQIEEIATREKIECDFDRIDGYLFVPPGDSTQVLDKELDAVHRAGLVRVTRVSRAPVTSFDTGPCLKFPRQGQFHPLKYLSGLADAVGRYGGQIFSKTHAERIKGGDTVHIETENRNTIAAKAIVVATNTPVNDRFVMHTKQAAYRTYVIGARIPRGAVPKALYWDTLDPYHYIRLQSSPDLPYDVLIVGGEDHKTGQIEHSAQCHAALEQWTRIRFPMIESIEYRWSGQIIEPIDAMAFIGKDPTDKNVYIATGDSGNGMTHGTIAGILLTDLILGQENPWEKLYDPSRKTLRAASEFIRENANAVSQYKEWVTPGDVASIDEIRPGIGAIVRHGLEKIAVYRDEKGTLHKCSAVCPHLGGILQWNEVEKTWDCPLHGSRFSYEGKVLNGPAISGLRRI